MPRHLSDEPHRPFLLERDGQLANAAIRRFHQPQEFVQGGFPEIRGFLRPSGSVLGAEVGTFPVDAQNPSAIRALQ